MFFTIISSCLIKFLNFHSKNDNTMYGSLVCTVHYGFVVRTIASVIATLRGKNAQERGKVLIKHKNVFPMKLGLLLLLNQLYNNNKAKKC